MKQSESIRDWAMSRAEMERELARLVRSPKLRAPYLRLDDNRLTAAIDRLQETERLVNRIGHVAAVNREAKTITSTKSKSLLWRY